MAECKSLAVPEIALTPLPNGKCVGCGIFLDPATQYSDANVIVRIMVEPATPDLAATRAFHQTRSFRASPFGWTGVGTGSKFQVNAPAGSPATMTVVQFCSDGCKARHRGQLEHAIATRRRQLREAEKTSNPDDNHKDDLSGQLLEYSIDQNLINSHELLPACWFEGTNLLPAARIRKLSFLYDTPFDLFHRQGAVMKLPTGMMARHCSGNCLPMDTVLQASAVREKHLVTGGLRIDFSSNRHLQENKVLNSLNQSCLDQHPTAHSIAWGEMHHNKQIEYVLVLIVDLLTDDNHVISKGNEMLTELERAFKANFGTQVPNATIEWTPMSRSDLVHYNASDLSFNCSNQPGAYHLVISQVADEVKSIVIARRSGSQHDARVFLPTVTVSPLPTDSAKYKQHMLFCRGHCEVFSPVKFLSHAFRWHE